MQRDSFRNKEEGSSLVSIVMPTYKGVGTIKAALEGVRHQTYAPIELIVVDDNGRGTAEQAETEKIVRSYEDVIAVRYIAHEENRNGSAARNTGMRAASGTYIAFLDDDDYMLPDKIGRQVETFASLSPEVGLVACSGFVVDREGYGKPLVCADGDMLFLMLTGQQRFNSSMMMIRREVFETTGGFDESYARHQDWEYVCRILTDYQGRMIDDRLVVKYSLSRNYVSDPVRALKNREYFLKKNAGVIGKFSRREQKQILGYHYRCAARLFLRSDRKKAFELLGRAGFLPHQAALTAAAIARDKREKKQKCAPSFDEVLRQA